MKALIVDDEPLASKYLRGLIEKHCFEISQIEIFNLPLEALEHLKSNVYDIIFLDVEMPELDGFELLDQANLSPKTQVIFTTAYSQYAIEAIKANATHYLIKMISPEDLITAVRRASKSLQQQFKANRQNENSRPRTISVYQDNEHHIIKEQSIIRLEAKGSYTLIVSEDKKLLSSKGIGTFEKSLSSNTFFRCHNSHLVNIKMISRIGKGKNGYAILANEELIPIASGKRDELEKNLGLLN